MSRGHLLDCQDVIFFINYEGKIDILLFGLNDKIKSHNIL